MSNISSRYFSLFYIFMFIFLLKTAPGIFGAVIFGIYISSIYHTPTNLLLKKYKKLNKFLHLLVEFSTIFIIIIALYNLIPLLISESNIIINKLSNIDFTKNTLNLPSWLFDMWTDINEKIVAVMLDFGKNALTSTPGTLIFIMISLITAFSFNSIKTYFSDKLEFFFPCNDSEAGIRFVRESYNAFNLFVQGQFIVSTMSALLIGIFTFFIGLKGFFFVAVLYWITDFLPFVGIFICLIFVALLGYSTDGINGMLVSVIGVYIINQIEAWLISPRVQSSNLNIHWYITFISIMFCSGFFGIPGVYTALPLLMIIIIFWKTYFLKNISSK